MIHFTRIHKVSAAWIVMIALLITVLWSASFTVHSQTPLPTYPTETFTPTPLLPNPTNPQFTLVGQLIPAVNTGPDKGVGGAVMNGGPFKAYQPVEYHLYDSQNEQIKLGFSPDFEMAFGLKSLDGNPRGPQIIANATLESLSTPNIYLPVATDLIRYELYNTLWQDWAGRWMSVTGRFSAKGVLFVEAFKAAQPTGLSFLTQAPSLPPLPSSGDLQRSVSIMVRGYAKTTEYNPLRRGEHGYRGALDYTLSDINGQTFELFIYDMQPNNTTQINGQHSNDMFALQDVHGLVDFSGWQFRPARYPAKPNLIEVQSIQEIR